MLITIDGNSLTPELLYEIGYSHSNIELTEKAWKAVQEGRAVIDKIIQSKEVVYGVNTGFGNFSNVIIPEDKLNELQLNLIRSHACGVGEPLTPQRTRMLMALRINVLAKGNSGIREITLRQMVAALNQNCLPWVPSKGTVGASGDLAPLSHLALGLIGEGKMLDPQQNKFFPADQVLKKYNLEPIKLYAKEGLALINGTQFITALGAEALVRAQRITRQADCIAALTLEALLGTATAFHPAIHQSRPHRGQIRVASRLRSLLDYGGIGSEIGKSHKNCGKVQDSYTLRCIPQVHGICNDTLDFVNEILTTECNSATDNPMIFPLLPKSEKYSYTYFQHTPNDEEKGLTISGGNFHGEYPAKALDFLAIAVHEVGSISERRIERLVNPHYSSLPAFLVRNGGLNSGFMVAHCTAAALVSENKVLCHPSSIDSLPTSAGQEDHVSMGGFSARKALWVVEHVETCIAIELLCACQAIDLLRPLKTTKALEAIHSLVRSVVRYWDKDRHMYPDIEACLQLLRDDKVWNVVQPFINRSKL